MTPQEIKTLRAQLGISQTEFGRRIGLKLRQVQNIEAGSSKPSGSVLMLLEQLKEKMTMKIKIGQYELENDVDCKVTTDGYEIFSSAVEWSGISPSDFTNADWGMGGSILVIEE